MSGTTLRLPSDRAVDVVPGLTLTTVPGWTLDALNVGPFRSARGYDAHLARTLGSTFDWSDEFRFGDDTLLLETLILKVPERNRGTWHSMARRCCVSSRNSPQRSGATASMSPRRSTCCAMTAGITAGCSPGPCGTSSPIRWGARVHPFGWRTTRGYPASSVSRPSP